MNSVDVKSLMHILKIKLILDFIVSITFLISGVWLVSVGSPIETSIAIFGQSVSSADAGVTVIFLSAVILILVTRRLMTTAEYLIKAGTL